MNKLFSSQYVHILISKLIMGMMLKLSLFHKNYDFWKRQESPFISVHVDQMSCVIVQSYLINYNDIK